MRPTTSQWRRTRKQSEDVPFEVRELACEILRLGSYINIMSTTSRRKRKSHSTDDAKASVKKPRQVFASNEGDEEFHVIKASLILPISPVFANDPRAGVEEMLDSMVMR